jgi:hypothetical protein
MITTVVGIYDYHCRLVYMITTVYSVANYIGLLTWTINTSKEFYILFAVHIGIFI